MIHARSALYGAAVTLLSLMGCAAVEYHYYGLTIPDGCYSQGQLLGKLGADGWPDAPLSECQPDTVNKGKCVVELTADHFAKDLALKQCQSDLKACQGG